MSVMFPAGHGFRYSTEEQWTGDYWIDGKKIYAKVFTGTLTSKIETQPTNFIEYIVIANIEKILNNCGTATVTFNNEPAFTCAVPSIVHHGKNWQVIFSSGVSKTTDGIRLNFSSINAYSPTKVDYEVAVEYTKTTD